MDSNSAHTSVLSERPADAHPPIPNETALLLWFWIGVVAAIALVGWLVFGDDLRKRKLKPAPKPADPGPDQEWAHYPQPGDRS